VKDSIWHYYGDSKKVLFELNYKRGKLLNQSELDKFLEERIKFEEGE
jgi:hypothetical protein